MAGKQKPVCWAASGPSVLVQFDVSEPNQGDCLGQRCLGLNHHTGDPFLPLLTRGSTPEPRHLPDHALGSVDMLSIRALVCTFCHFPPQGQGKQAKYIKTYMLILQHPSLKISSHFIWAVQRRRQPSMPLFHTCWREMLDFRRVQPSSYLHR